MTSKPHFSPELRTMSIVPRWSIVFTLTDDYLSNHSYFVTMYAYDIARMLNWKGSLSALMYFGLVHDTEETISGDIVSVVKSEIIDEKRAADYLNLKMRERLPGIVSELEYLENMMTDAESDEAWAIIQVADRLDALLFLITEQRLGNAVIAPRIPSAFARLQSSWFALPFASEELARLWATVVTPSIKAHETTGGFGV